MERYIIEIWIENYQELKEIEIVYYDKIVEFYFYCLELDKKETKNLNYRRKIFKRTYIEKKYKS